MAVHALVFLEHSDIAQLPVEHPLRYRGLRNVRPVEVVHAVRAHYTQLQFHELWSVRVLVEIPMRLRANVSIRKEPMLIVKVYA